MGIYGIMLLLTNCEMRHLLMQDKKFSECQSDKGDEGKFYRLRHECYRSASSS